MSKKSKGKEDMGDEIKIPIELAEKIDRIIGTNRSEYTSKEEFIKWAVEMKLKEVKEIGLGFRWDHY